MYVNLGWLSRSTSQFLRGVYGFFQRCIVLSLPIFTRVLSISKSLGNNTVTINFFLGAKLVPRIPQQLYTSSLVFGTKGYRTSVFRSQVATNLLRAKLAQCLDLYTSKKKTFPSRNLKPWKTLLEKGDFQATMLDFQAATVDGSEIRLTTWDVRNPVNNGITY